MISKELLKEVEKITGMSVRLQKSKKRNDRYVLKAMKEHAEEIAELFRKKDPHYANETADIIILALELLINNEVDPNIPIKRRLGRFKEKITEGAK
jgi:polysaccharide pyruvyl transferase WcaK-like protein